MSKTTKTLLALSLTGLVTGLAFVTGWVNVQNAVALYVALPAGAIFFGLFLIAKLLEKETAQYDAEQRTLRAYAERFSRRAVKAAKRAEHSAAPTREPSLVSSH